MSRPDLIAALSRLDYPSHALDIKLLIEGDDVETLAAALALGHAPHIEILVIPPARPRTKPKALNAGLAAHAANSSSCMTRKIAPIRSNCAPPWPRSRMAGRSSRACAPLAIDNAGASWIARQFAAEYAIQFREMLPLLARLGLPLPLGGTSNHFRAEALRKLGGWDSYNVSEDRANFANKLNRFRTHAFHIPFVSHSCASAA